MSEDLSERVVVLEVKGEMSERRLASIETKLDELIALKNQGKGSIWLLVTIGGVVGATISNAKAILKIFAP